MILRYGLQWGRFKQERPVSELSSGHGMPSLHAQNIFFMLVFMIKSGNIIIHLLLLYIFLHFF